MLSFRIRPAVPADVPAMFQLIQQLAAYEKLEHQVTGSVELLHEHIFGENAVASVLLAEVPDSQHPVGQAIYFRTFSTFLTRPGLYLEDLFVQPEYRGRGIGKAFLVNLAKIAVEQGYGRLEWMVLDWNEPAIQFYSKIGALQLSEWIPNRVTGAALLQLAQSEKEDRAGQVIS